MKPIVRRLDRVKWLPGAFINDDGYAVVSLDSVQYKIVKWADALIRFSMRK